MFAPPRPTPSQSAAAPDLLTDVLHATQEGMFIIANLLAVALVMIILVAATLMGYYATEYRRASRAQRPAQAAEPPIPDLWSSTVVATLSTLKHGSAFKFRGVMYLVSAIIVIDEGDLLTRQLFQVHDADQHQVWFAVSHYAADQTTQPWVVARLERLADTSELCATVEDHVQLRSQSYRLSNSGVASFDARQAGALLEGKVGELHFEDYEGSSNGCVITLEFEDEEWALCGHNLPPTERVVIYPG